MMSLIKYELKGRYKYYIVFLSVLILMNIYLLIKGNTWGKNGASVGLSMMLAFVAVVITVISNIGVYKRDLYESTGYLLFTLPQSGYSIVASKFITAFIEFISVSIISGLLAYVQIFNVVPMKDVYRLTGEVFNNLGTALGYMLLFYVFGFFTIMILVYLSLTISKAVLKGKRFGRITSLGVFILTIYVLGKLDELMVKVFPKTIKINLQPMYFGNSSISHADAFINLNIASSILSIVVFIAMFVLTGYLLDRKVDV